MPDKQRAVDDEDPEGEGGGSYTDRPSKEVPEEGGRTRKEEDEVVERTGTPGRERPTEDE